MCGRLELSISTAYAAAATARAAEACDAIFGGYAWVAASVALTSGSRDVNRIRQSEYTSNPRSWEASRSDA